MESFVSELAQEVRCSLCSDRLQEPKLLRCFHTYCKACIKRHAELQPDIGDNIFKCPECLTEISLPDLSDVEGINPSPLHARILKVLEFVESEMVCSVSKSHSAASCYCFECTRMLCDECQTNHSLFTRDNHKVVCLSSLKKEDLEFMLAKEDDCNRHDGCKLDFFCQDCETLICLDCLKLDHRNHKTVLSEQHLSAVRESLDDQMKRLSIQEHKMSADAKVLEDFAVDTKDKGDRAIREIQAKAKEIIEKVQESERELIKEIRDQIDNSEKEMMIGRNLLSKTRRARYFVNQAIEKRMPASRMKNVQDVVRPILYDVVPGVQDCRRVVFVASEECSELMKVGLGRLIHKKSYVSSSDEKDNEGVEDNFTLIDGTICEKEDRFCTYNEDEGQRKAKASQKAKRKRELKAKRRDERERRLKEEEEMRNPKDENENETNHVESFQEGYETPYKTSLFFFSAWQNGSKQLNGGSEDESDLNMLKQINSRFHMRRALVLGTTSKT